MLLWSRCAGGWQPNSSLSVMPGTQRPIGGKGALDIPVWPEGARADTHSGGDRDSCPGGRLPRVQTVRPSGEVIEGAVVLLAPGEA